MEWSSVFDESQPTMGASDAEIDDFVRTVGQPLSAAEIAEVNQSQKNPFPPSHPSHAEYRPFDPSIWMIPDRPLAADYLSFLRWSNGGWFRTGEREFGFFPTAHPTGGVRAMMFAYHFPQYMPGALPFAFNGGGTFYIFDMRRPAGNANYPVVCSHAGAIGWEPDEYWTVADSFEAVCRGSVNVDDLRATKASTEFNAVEPVTIYLERPLKSLKTLLLIREHLGVAMPMGELKAIALSPPCRIAEGLTYGQAIHRCAKVNAVEPCLGIRLLRDPTIQLPLE